MITPPAPSTRDAAWQPLKTPLMLTSTIWSSCSGVYESSGMECEMPALLHTMSSPPKCSAASRNAASSAASSATFGQMPMTGASGFSARMASTAFCAVSSRLPHRATFAPSSRKRLTIARPMPREPPVTTAVFPVSSMVLLSMRARASARREARCNAPYPARRPRPAAMGKNRYAVARASACVASLTAGTSLLHVLDGTPAPASGGRFRRPAAPRSRPRGSS